MNSTKRGNSNSNILNTKSKSLSSIATLPELYDFLMSEKTNKNIKGMKLFDVIHDIGCNKNFGELSCVEMDPKEMTVSLLVQLAMTIWIDNCNGTITQSRIEKNLGITQVDGNYNKSGNSDYALVLLYSKNVPNVSPAPMGYTDVYVSTFFIGIAMVKKTPINEFANIELSKGYLNTTPTESTLHETIKDVLYIDVFCSKFDAAEKLEYKGAGTCLLKTLEYMYNKSYQVFACRGIKTSYDFWTREDIGFKRTNGKYIFDKLKDENGPIAYFSDDTDDNGFLMMKEIVQSGGKKTRKAQTKKTKKTVSSKKRVSQNVKKQVKN